MKKILSVLFLFSSCAKEKNEQYMVKPDSCDSSAFTFNKDILPIFQSYCNFDECHASGGKGSYDFTNYSLVADRIRAGTMEYRLDLPSDDPQHMPLDMRISNCDYYTIKTWILQGYPEN